MGIAEEFSSDWDEKERIRRNRGLIFKVQRRFAINVHDMAFIMSKLPEDCFLERIVEDFAEGTWGMVLTCMKFKELPPGTIFPDVIVSITMKDHEHKILKVEFIDSSTNTKLEF